MPATWTNPSGQWHSIYGRDNALECPAIEMRKFIDTPAASDQCQMAIPGKSSFNYPLFRDGHHSEHVQFSPDFLHRQQAWTTTASNSLQLQQQTAGFGEEWTPFSTYQLHHQADRVDGSFEEAAPFSVQMAQTNLSHHLVQPFSAKCTEIDLPMKQHQHQQQHEWVDDCLEYPRDAAAAGYVDEYVHLAIRQSGLPMLSRDTPSSSSCSSSYSPLSSTVYAMDISPSPWMHNTVPDSSSSDWTSIRSSSVETANTITTQAENATPSKTTPSSGSSGGTKKKTSKTSKPSKQKQKQNTSRSTARDLFLIECKRRGMSYKEIKRIGHFEEAESTLRGRFRTLTKSKEQRVRKPKWEDGDVRTYPQTLQTAYSDDILM